MKHSYSGEPTDSSSQVALHLMINQLSVTTLPSAMRNRKIVINDIPTAMYVNADPHQLAAVIGGVMNAVIDHSSNSSMRISAKSYGNVMLLHFKDNSRLNSPAFAGCLVDIQDLVEQMGGNVSVTSYRNEITTVALSFVTTPAAA